MGSLSSAIFLLELFFLVVCFEVAGIAAAQNECSPASCRGSGPIIRFPFWLKGLQPDHCGFPGFGLSCSGNNTADFELQHTVMASTNNLLLPIRTKISVEEIDYRSQRMGITYISSDCLPKQLANFNSSTDVNSSASTPFSLAQGYNYDYTLFNCSSNSANNSQKPSTYGTILSCLSSRDYQVYAFRSGYSVSDLILSSCVKMYNVSDVPAAALNAPSENDFITTYLQWSKPSCGNCEARGLICRLKNNGTDDQTECFDINRKPGDVHGAPKNIIIPVVVLGVFVVLVALYCIIRLKKKKDDERKFQKFLEDYKALIMTRFSYSYILKITDNLKYKLGQGGFGTVYKGKLSNDIVVAVKVLNNFKGNGEEFINEVRTIGKIHHVNVVRLVGYCADGYRRALVYEFLPNDSLDKFIKSPKKINELGWEKLQQIAIGIAKGLDYLHQGCNQRILHFDIKPQNILLDHSYNPKVADFGLAKMCSKEQSVVFMTAARGTIGYIAPEVFSRNFGNVSYKSDVYSFGMLLLDMVGGRKNFHGGAEDETSEIYYPEWMYKQLEKGEDIAIIQIEKEEDGNVFKRIAIVGLWCIQWYPADRPSMKVVIQMLEGENMPIIPPNPFHSTNSPISSHTEYLGASTSLSSSQFYSISHASDSN